MPAINQPLSNSYYVAKASVLNASETIPYGHVAMQVGGQIRAALTGVSGSKLLGMVLAGQGLIETTGSDVTLAQPAAFARGLVVYLDAKSGDEPTAANLGGSVALDTSSQVKATVAGDDLTLIMVDLRADGKIGVYIP
mgnify:CR=1 FL=1